jgi:hypothetical protein
VEVLLIYALKELFAIFGVHQDAIWKLFNTVTELAKIICHSSVAL